jgi:predicted transposase YdaD
MALYPLCRHGRPPREALTYAATAIRAATPDTIRRADLLTTLAIFGKLAYRRLDVADLIGREQMKESALYEEIKDEGRIETGQAFVLKALEARFGREAAARFADAVRRVTKLEKLGRLLTLASRCTTAEEFQKALRPR